MLQTLSLDLNVTFVNANTQKGQRMINAYVKSKYDNIYQAYGKPSSAKVSAFEEIKQEMKDASGRSMRITGAGSDYFSCAYKVDDVNGDTYLIYHTHVNRFAIKL